MRAEVPSAVGGLGIFGGTFNPIHVGHLRAAEEVVEALGLDRLYFVPSARPPHKVEEDGEVIAPPAERLEWARLAVAGNAHFGVDPIEIEREGPSFLVETLQTLGERTAPELPVFVVGRDAFQEMDEWREPRRLFELAHFVVMTRPPLLDGTLTDWLPRCVRNDIELAADGLSGRHRSAHSWVRLLAITALDVSASAIRARLREHRSTRYLMPDEVRRAVLASGCYSGPGSGSTGRAAPESSSDPTPNADNTRAQELSA